MRSDFKPVHLQEANRRLERELELLSAAHYQKEDDTHTDDDSAKTSLWNKFVRLFKAKPSDELPEDLHR